MSGIGTGRFKHIASIILVSNWKDHKHTETEKYYAYIRTLMSSKNLINTSDIIYKQPGHSIERYSPSKKIYFNLISKKITLVNGEHAVRAYQTES